MFVKCNRCSGNGYFYLSTGIIATKKTTCKVCGGAGRIEVPDNAVSCARCSGKGYEGSVGAGKLCPACSGTGKNIVKTYL